MTNTPTTTHPTITDQPAAWIGCLSCYNNGQLRGRWITAQEAADEITADQITYGKQAETVTTGDYTTQRCRKCGGDEFDAFDTQHTPASCRNVKEFYENAEQLTELHDAGTLARLIVLADWIGDTTTLDDLQSYDEEHYRGEWNRFQDYAEQYAEDVGDLAAMPAHLQSYFDYEKYARDLAYNYYHDDTTGHIWYSA